MAQVISLNVVFAEIPDVGGSIGRTSIDKRPVTDRRLVTSDGVAGDQRSDMIHHGSTKQAVYSYAREDYDWWAGELGRDLPAGVFGENLTTTGVDLNELPVGTQVRVGTSLLEISAPRIPCGTFGRWLAQEHWVKRFTQVARCGAYLRVLESGELGAGDDFEIVFTPDHGVTIRDVFHAWNGVRDVELLTRVAQCPDAEDEVRERAKKFLAQ